MACRACLEVGYRTVVIPPYKGLSRTAVDINRLYKDSAHTGPTGRGGSVWVADRGTGNAMQYDLRNGKHNRTYICGRPGRGFGIAIHTDNGSCLAGPGQYKLPTLTSKPRLYYCDIERNTQYSKTVKKTNAQTGSYYETTTYNSSQLIGSLDSKAMCYGIIPLYGYPDRFFLTDHENDGPGGIFILGSDYTTGQFLEAGLLDGYAAASCPNGYGVQAGTGFIGGAFVHPETANAIKKSFVVSDTNVVATTAKKIGVDNYAMYPNTLVNTEGSRDMFCIKYRNEYNITLPLSATSTSDVSINWIISPSVESDLTPGYDGENNLWTVDSNSYKRKLYRTAGDWYDGDGVDDAYVYPYGGYSRYPTVGLDSWPMTLTNTKEIEWFLTRAHGIVTRLKGSSPSITTIDATTLDDTTAVYWNPDQPSVQQTAYDAWWSMVETKMSRKTYGDWKVAPYFKVYGDNKEQQVGARHWGIRMDVSDIKPTNQDLDYFYEFESSTWIPYVIDRIRSWYNAFANSDTAYPTVANRADLIQGNRTGITIHSFYKFASPYSNYPYVNPALSVETKNAINYYAGQLKYYDFESPQVSDLYMYSDYTGNILAGTTEKTSLNISVIHPEPSSPSISLAVSAAQTNPGYQDTPTYCYPWKNTLPVPTSGFYNSISGYDDLNVTFKISAYMGSYDFTSFSLSTDDYWPAHLTDIGNTAILKPALTTAGTVNVEAIANYTYHSPSVNGITFIPLSAGTSINRVDAKTDGVFRPRANIQVTNLYDYGATGCSTASKDVSAEITVYERWSEPKFYLEDNEDKYIRQNFFCNNTWGRSCAETYISEQTTISSCPAGYDGYTTMVRNITVIEGLIAAEGDWEVQDGYCYITTTETSAICATVCPQGYDGTLFYERDRRESYYPLVTSYTPWVETLSCFPPTVTTQVSVVSTTDCVLPYEGYHIYSRDVSATAYDQISTYGSWTDVLSCIPPTVFIESVTGTCPAGYTGYTTETREVSVSFVTQTSSYGTWSIADSSICGLPCGAVAQYSGGESFPTITKHILGTNTGSVRVVSDAYNVPDKIQVSIDDVIVYDTGYRGHTGWQSSLNSELISRGYPPETITSPGDVDSTFTKSTSTQVAYVSVWAPLDGTAWKYTMYCPA